MAQSVHRFFAQQLLRSLLLGFAVAGPVVRETGSWSNLAPVVIGTLQEHTTVAISDTQLVTVGGLVEGGTTTDLVLRYDIDEDEWYECAPIPDALNHPNVVAVDGKVYLLGGLGGDNMWKGLPTSAVYDVDEDAWSVLAPMPEGTVRGSAIMGVYNGTVYLAGGIPSAYRGTLDTVTAYNIASDEWVDLPDAARAIPEPRDHGSGAVIGHKFYVVGGRNNGLGEVQDSVFVLDLEDLEAGWSTSEARMPTPRGGISGAAIGEKFYVFGGEGNPEEGSRGVFESVEVYDAEKDEWDVLAAMDTPRHGTSAAAAGGKIYIPGGGIVQGVGATDLFDVFTP